MDNHILLGKTITGIKISTDNEALLFEVEQGESIPALCDADCCSYTWIENVELPTAFPAKVLAVEDIPLPGSTEDHENFECIEVYGLKITTDKGVCIIDYRNSSNGYYGGCLVWPGESHYGGVYGQNKKDHEWQDIEEGI